MKFNTFLEFELVSLNSFSFFHLYKSYQLRLHKFHCTDLSISSYGTLYFEDIRS